MILLIKNIKCIHIQNKKKNKNHCFEKNQKKKRNIQNIQRNQSNNYYIYQENIKKKKKFKQHKNKRKKIITKFPIQT